MRNKRFGSIVLALVFSFCLPQFANSQSWLKKLGEKAVEAAKNTVERKVEQKTEATVSDAMDGKTGKKGKGGGNNNSNRNTNGNADGKDVADEGAVPTATTTSDFKRGATILFQDDFANEPVGEFPSKWDLLDGTAEVKNFDGQKVLNIGGKIIPLMKTQGAYLPEEFTLEFEWYYFNQDLDGGEDLYLILGRPDDVEDKYANRTSGDVPLNLNVDAELDDRCFAHVQNTNDQGVNCGEVYHSGKRGWHLVQISFNKRALKVYIDGKRFVNHPNVMRPAYILMEAYHVDGVSNSYIRNLVLAQGAVELYDRDAQNLEANVAKAVEQTGKFVTNNILFETGKADLKPESMTEIMKVCMYMQQNPDIKFEVQGHCDNQGSDKVNDPLSQKRSDAIVAQLVALGIDQSRLSAVGKGSHEPVADNATEEGRAKNRRVEFVKK